MTGQHSGGQPDADRRIFSGLPDVYVRPYEHLGHFYAGREERFGVLVPFIVAGLDAGDHCLCPILEQDVDDLAARLDEAGVDVAGVTADRQLVTTPGRSSAPEMARLFAEASREAHLAGRGMVRICADMTWTLEQMPSSEGLLEWEAMYDVVFTDRRHPTAFVALCQYDHTAFDGAGLMYGLQTHPVCIIGDVVQNNPFHRNPDEVLTELGSGSLREFASEQVG